MKRLFLYTLVVMFLASCSNSGNGELVGTRKNQNHFISQILMGWCSSQWVVILWEPEMKILLIVI